MAPATTTHTLRRPNDQGNGQSQTWRLPRLQFPLCGLPGLDTEQMAGLTRRPPARQGTTHSLRFDFVSRCPHAHRWPGRAGPHSTPRQQHHRCLLRRPQRGIALQRAPIHPGRHTAGRSTRMASGRRPRCLTSSKPEPSHSDSEQPERDFRPRHLSAPARRLQSFQHRPARPYHHAAPRTRKRRPSGSGPRDP